MAQQLQKAQVLKSADNCWIQTTASRQYQDGITDYFVVPVCGVWVAPIFAYRPNGKASFAESIVARDPVGTNQPFPDGGPRCHTCTQVMKVAWVNREKKYLSPRIGKDGQTTTPYKWVCEHCEDSVEISHHQDWREDKKLMLPKKRVNGIASPIFTKFNKVCGVDNG